MHVICTVLRAHRVNEMRLNIESVLLANIVSGCWCDCIGKPHPICIGFCVSTQIWLIQFSSRPFAWHRRPSNVIIFLSRKKKEKKDSISYCCVCFFPQSFFVSAVVCCLRLPRFEHIIPLSNGSIVHSFPLGSHLDTFIGYFFSPILSLCSSLSDILRVSASACALCIECALFWHYSFNTGQPRWQSKSSVIVVICLETDKRIETKMNETIIDEWTDVVVDNDVGTNIQPNEEKPKRLKPQNEITVPGACNFQTNRFLVPHSW